MQSLMRSNINEKYFYWTKIPYDFFTFTHLHIFHTSYRQWTTTDSGHVNLLTI